MKTAEIIKLINDYWRFDINQVPRSTWHEKQDLIEIIQKSESVSEEKDRRIRELEEALEYAISYIPEYHRAYGEVKDVLNPPKP